MNLTGFALRNQPLVTIIVIALVAFAGMALTNFPSQEDPPITVREAVVTTFLPGMEAEDVEMGMRYMAECRVLVISAELDPEAERGADVGDVP